MSSPSKQYETMNESVPIFLKKTYHMIDSCDPEIAGWDDDGLTFTVKDPLKFETLIIPQFFKHSKFTSFVRQLNFYAFRKIKYSDSIRIDLETEKRTANYWRFRHEHFQRGRADLLVEIKRMNGKASATTNGHAAAIISATGSSKTPLAVPSAFTNVAIAGATVNVAEKAEVVTLRKRIDEMTKNIDKLTEMVQKVSLQQENQSRNVMDESVELGVKRKKASPDPGGIESSESMDMLTPDAALSNLDLMDLGDFPVLPEAVLSREIPSPPPSLPISRENSDSEFVDQLFAEFENDGIAADWLNSSNDGDEMSSNRPDPELMKRLSDALSLLPRDIQEMIITRLITAITSTDCYADVVPVADTLSAPAALIEPMPVVSARIPIREQEPPKPIPLAAATLAALLHHYSIQVKEQTNSAKASQAKVSQAKASQAKKTLKSLPVIPVHA